MFTRTPTLAELWHLHAQHHTALKAFVLAKAAFWHEAGVRRTARHGLAVLASMLRRLLHLLALEVALPPLSPRTKLEPIPPLTRSRARRLRFRLTETTRERPRRTKNPHPAPDTAELAHALVLGRLALLAHVYRARHRIARRLARRVQSGRAPLAALPLPPVLYARVLAGFRIWLDYLDVRLLEARQRAPPSC